jgi:hypothetical protein
MLRVKVQKIRNGMHPSEIVVAVALADGGKEEIVVDQRSVKNNSLRVGYPVASKRDRVLIELPRESTRGLWRVWVSDKSVVREREAA